MKGFLVAYDAFWVGALTENTTLGTKDINSSMKMLYTLIEPKHIIHSLARLYRQWNSFISLQECPYLLG